jgi:hypothetical protein
MDGESRPEENQYKQQSENQNHCATTPQAPVKELPVPMLQHRYPMCETANPFVCDSA